MDDIYKIKVNEISPFPIRIARQGEANYRRLEIDVSAWLAEYPLGTVSGIFVRADGTSYPVVLTITDGIASWSPAATETTAAGAAQLVLQITSGSVIGRSATIGLRVVESPAAGATPPAVDSPWISAVIDAAATYPYVGSNGHWFTFDGESGLWVDTGVSAQGSYVKPADGIPASDMTSAVQTSLALADSALQSHQDISGKADKPTAETYTIATASWSALASSSPYTYSATVTATHTIGNDTVCKLINDNAVLFATYGFAIGAVSGQSVTIYSIGQPSASVTLEVDYIG